MELCSVQEGGGPGGRHEDGVGEAGACVVGLDWRVVRRGLVKRRDEGCTLPAVVCFEAGGHLHCDVEFSCVILGPGSELSCCNFCWSCRGKANDG